MTKVKYCKDCAYSAKNPDSTWELRCHNPVVNAKDAWALSNIKMNGTNCHTERDLSWIKFPKCGMSGKLWVEIQT